MQFQTICPHCVADPRAIISASKSSGSITGSTVPQKQKLFGFEVDQMEGRKGWDGAR